MVDEVVMTTLSGYDSRLERPYQRQCQLEERFNEIVDSETEYLWLSMRDEIEVEQFLRDWEPENLCRDLVQAIAIAKDEFGKQLDKQAYLHSLFGKLQVIVERNIEKVATHKAESRMDI